MLLSQRPSSVWQVRFSHVYCATVKVLSLIVVRSINSIIALSHCVHVGLLNAETGQLVLAGDPKQLGPILRSPLAINHGLGEKHIQTHTHSLTHSTY